MSWYTLPTSSSSTGAREPPCNSGRTFISEIECARARTRCPRHVTLKRCPCGLFGPYPKHHSRNPGSPTPVSRQSHCGCFPTCMSSEPRRISSKLTVSVTSSSILRCSAHRGRGYDDHRITRDLRATREPSDRAVQRAPQTHSTRSTHPASDASRSVKGLPPNLLLPPGRTCP